MIRVIFTYRPFSISKPISIMNSITRWIFGHPRDHVAIIRDHFVYESTFSIPKEHRKDGQKSGVHKIEYQHWIKGREMTDTNVYLVPEADIDFEIFEDYESTKYDIRAALFHFLQKIDKDGKWRARLAKRRNKAFTCSELVACMFHMEHSYKASPKDVEEYLRSKNYQSINDII